MVEFVPMEQWGKDHWSTFAYIETLCVDGTGTPDPRRMRTNGRKYPTRLKEGKELSNHNDWDCAKDLEAAGLILDVNGFDCHPIPTTSGLKLPKFKLTELGWMVIGQLRKHLASGGIYFDFNPAGVSKEKQEVQKEVQEGEK